MAPSAGALSYRKLPRLFKPSHCQLLRHHAQLVAVQFYAMQLVTTQAAKFPQVRRLAVRYQPARPW